MIEFTSIEKFHIKARDERPALDVYTTKLPIDLDDVKLIGEKILIDGKEHICVGIETMGMHRSKGSPAGIAVKWTGIRSQVDGAGS